MEIEPEKIISALGGASAVNRMDSESRAEKLEGYLSDQLNMAVFAKMGAPSHPMTVRELDEQIEQRPVRRGIGTLFASGGTNPFGNRLPSEPVNVRHLAPIAGAAESARFFPVAICSRYACSAERG